MVHPISQKSSFDDFVGGLTPLSVLEIDGGVFECLLPIDTLVADSPSRGAAADVAGGARGSSSLAFLVRRARVPLRQGSERSRQRRPRSVACRRPRKTVFEVSSSALDNSDDHF